MWPVEFGREESRRRLQNLVRPPQLSVLPPQLLDLRLRLGRDTRPLPGIDLRPANPGSAERLLDIARARGVAVTKEAVQEVKANTQSAASIAQAAVATLQRAAALLTERDRRRMIAGLEAVNYGATQPFRDWASSEIGRSALLSASEYLARKHEASDALSAESSAVREALERLENADFDEPLT